MPLKIKLFNFLVRNERYNIYYPMDAIKAWTSSALVMPIIIGFVLGIILLVGGNYLVGKPIISNIGKLTELSQSIAKGDLSNETIVVDSQDEIGILSENFREMTVQLKNIISSTSNSVNILNSASEDLLSGTEEINSSTEEVASTSQAMSDGATTQTELISEVNESVIRVQQIVDEIVKKIQMNTQEVAQIALQTNILALNAGIEASRAGDYGRGFAVVAENVRKLSDQSKLASERIESVADEIGETLQRSFTLISQTMINVVSVSEETAASAEEVAAAAEEMTATLEELSTSAQELSSQAENSNRIINTFRL